MTALQIAGALAVLAGVWLALVLPVALIVDGALVVALAVAAELVSTPRTGLSDAREGTTTGKAS